jgi:hypothetical protein
MAIPLVQVRHKSTGRKGFMAESSLRYFPDWVKAPSQRAREEVPDGTAFAAEPAEENSESAEENSTTETTASSASATTTTKGK